MFKKGDSSKRTLISSQGCEWLLFSAPGWEEREEAEDSLCLRPSFTEYQCFLPPGHKHWPGDFCVYTSISTLCRCTTGKGLCARIGGLSSTSNLIPRVAPGPRGSRLSCCRPHSDRLSCGSHPVLLLLYGSASTNT